MSRDLILGIDVGTTACKLLAVRADGCIEGSAACDYPLHTLLPGHAEQDAHEVWHGVLGALGKLLATLSPDRFAGISFSGAMHGVMPVDRAGVPLSRAMTWADNRAIGNEAQLRLAHDHGAIYHRTGCPLRWLYLPAKLRWLREQQRTLFDRAARFVSIKDWLIHRLTGLWATDICIASGTGLLDLRTLQWDRESLAMAGIDESRLPTLAMPQQIIGQLTRDGSAATGLPAGLPIMPGGGDGGLANIGAGGAEPGSVVATVGTSGAVRVTSASPLLDPHQRTWCYALTDQLWYAGGAINNGGLAVETIRRLFYGDCDKEEGFGRLFEDAATIPAGSEDVLILPYFAGERSPHWRPDLHATMLGLTNGHHRAHIARAVLESVAYCLADVWGALRESGKAKPAVIHLTGGITKSLLWSQIVCDVLAVPVTLSEAGDASALGAAAIGHWGLGHVASLKAFPIAADHSITLTPHPQHQRIYAEKHREFQEEGKRMMAKGPTSF